MIESTVFKSVTISSVSIITIDKFEVIWDVIIYSCNPRVLKRKNNGYSSGKLCKASGDTFFHNLISMHLFFLNSYVVEIKRNPNHSTSALFFFNNYLMHLTIAWK